MCLGTLTGTQGGGWISHGKLVLRQEALKSEECVSHQLSNWLSTNRDRRYLLLATPPLIITVPIGRLCLRQDSIARQSFSSSCFTAAFWKVLAMNDCIFRVSGAPASAIVIYRWTEDINPLYEKASCPRIGTGNSNISFSAPGLCSSANFSKIGPAPRTVGYAGSSHERPSERDTLSKAFLQRQLSKGPK